MSSNRTITKAFMRIVASICIWACLIGGWIVFQEYFDDSRQSWIYVSGKVVDPQGRPISGVRIQAFSSSDPQPFDTSLSMKESEYTGDYLIGGNFVTKRRETIVVNFVVEKEGYVTYREQFDKLQMYYRDHTIVLQPAAP